MHSLATELHQLVNEQKRYSFPFTADISEIPLNGIYFLFEKGERFETYDRIVRIGTNRGAGNLLKRLNEHFVIENKNRSIFRKNIGRCILNATGGKYLTKWELGRTSRKERLLNTPLVDFAFEANLEGKITNFIQGNCTFCVVQIDSNKERMYWEKKLIATVAQADIIKPSDNWFGRQSPVLKIASGRLWQVQHLKSKALTETEFNQFKPMLGGGIMDKH